MKKQWGPRGNKVFVGRGEATERMSLRACAETNDAAFATTKGGDEA